MANPIHKWLEEQEADDSLSIEQFYGRLLGALGVLQERLEGAESDGVDIETVELEE